MQRRAPQNPFLIHGVADEGRPQSSLCKRPHFIHVAIAVSAPVVADHVDVGATPDIVQISIDRSGLSPPNGKPVFWMPLIALGG